MSDLAATAAAEDEGRGRYRALVWRRQLILAGLGLALVFSICIDLALGPARYSLAQVVQALVAPDSVDQAVRVVLWEIRMPIALMAVVVGAALSIAGAQMQTILNNPLASPFTLGISAAASFGAALSLAFGMVLIPAAIEYVVPVNAFVMAMLAIEYVVPVNAFVMAMLAALVVHLLSIKRGVTVETIVLIGIALVFTFNALLSLVQYLASAEALAAVVFWTMGSLTKATWPKLAITTLALLVTLPVFARRAWALTALRLGEDKAASFGIKVSRLRLETMLMVSLLAAIPVAFVGTIGFIGLVGPHIARMLIGEDQRFFLPASALAGALILSAASVISKTLVPGTIFPIGVVTSLVGIPFFISLILSNTRRAW